MKFDVEALRKLEREATPGPWARLYMANDVEQADEDLSSAARNALPALLDEIERLRKIEAVAKRFADGARKMRADRWQDHVGPTFHAQEELLGLFAEKDAT